MIDLVVGSVIAALGLWFGATCYWRLWRFARECQQARIVIAKKGRVTLNAPVVEWLLWIRLLDKDKESNGRMIYNYAGTSVSIIKKSFGLPTPVHEFFAWVLRKGKFDKTWGWQAKGGNQPQLKSSKPARPGRWKSQDETDVTRNKRDA